MKQNGSCESVWQSEAEWNFLPLLVVEEQECLSLWVYVDTCVLCPGEEITFPAIPSC